MDRTARYGLGRQDLGAWRERRQPFAEPGSAGRKREAARDVRRPEEVFVFVRRGEQFLVLHRSERNGAYWHGVAGALEDGEDYGQAAARELREETGLVAQPLETGGAYAYSVCEDPEWRTRYPPGTREILVRSFLVVAPTDWEPELDWEHDDYRWCNAAEAEELLYWPEPRQVLRTLE